MVHEIRKRILLTSVLFANVLALLACRCQGESIVSDCVKNSDVVFKGELIVRYLTNNYNSLNVSIEEGAQSNIDTHWQQYKMSVNVFKVDKYYKGKSKSDTIVILTPPNGAACGVRFYPNKKYIVYAFGENQLPTPYCINDSKALSNIFWTHMCTRTQVWNIQEEIEIEKWNT